MARLLQQTAIRRGAITFAKRIFDRRARPKALERRIHISFPVANVPVTRPHSLGFTPSSWSPVGLRGAGGTVYETYPWASQNYVTFRCTVANTVAEIILR